MLKRILIGLALVIVFVAAVTVYLGVATAADLLAARRALQGDVAELEADEIEEARDRLESASDRLDGFLASTVGIVPVVGQNLRAIEAVSDGAGPVLDSALELRKTADEIEEQDLVEAGRVQLDLIERLASPLRGEAEALDELHAKLEAARSGWLLPPVFEELVELERRTEELRATAGKAAAAAELAPEMLGGAGARTYLVVLINNAELRGAGGILSGVGTVTMRDGKIELGGFSPYGQLGSRPYEAVDAPDEFERRYAFAKANTTLWINTTYSPNVPDVALVASRLYEKVRGISTDGAIVVDPRGIAALMPPDATVLGPTGGELNAGSLPEYIYSTAYEELGGNESERRASLLAVGRGVFSLLAQRGPGGVDELDDVAEAVSGGHLRFVSFEEDEDRLLDELGASGSLPQSEDSVFVAVQNHGPDKLDFWMRRSISHRCSIEEDGATCETSATLANEAPGGLTNYVSPRPNNESNEFLEIYVPGDADVAAVELDDRPVEFLQDTQDGRTAIGADVRVQSGESTTLRVTYELPLDGSYELTITPQPLAEDANVRVELDTPDDWTVYGPDFSEEGGITYEETLEGSLTFEAARTPRGGLSKLWDSLSNFWNDEVF